MEPIDVEALRRGRALIRIVIASTLMSDAGSSILKAVVVGHRYPAIPVLRWCLTAALLSALWRGASWARWLTVGLFTFGFAFGALFFFQWPSLMLASVTLQLAISLMILTCSENAEAFVTYQGRAHSKGHLDPAQDPAKPKTTFDEIA